MLSLLKAIFDTPKTGRDDLDEALVTAAIEKAVDGTDPRLRIVNGYQKKMRRAVIASIDYVNDVADRFGPTLTLSRQAFAADPQVHALFGSADDLQRVMRESAELRQFVAESNSSANATIFAGLRMTRSEKKVLAPEMQGGMVHQDVIRTIVNFSDHAIVIPSQSEAELRRVLKERIYIAIVQSALARLTSIKDHRAELEKQRSLLRTKLKVLSSGGLGLEPFTGQSTHAPGNAASIERQLRETERELKATVASLATLNEYIEQITDVLSRPAEHVRIRPSSTRLTPMGFKVAPDATEPGDDVFFVDLENSESERFAGRLVEFSRDLVVC